jgi:hypothetical protein
MLRSLLPLAAMLAGAALAMAVIAFVALRLDALQPSAAPVLTALAATPSR